MSSNTVKNDQENQGTVAENVPSEENCRTSHLLENYSNCLTGKRSCTYALPFGNGLFCKHPRHLEFGQKEREPK